MRVIALTVALALVAVAAAAQPAAPDPRQPVKVVFVEPDGATSSGELPLYRKVEDPARLAVLSKWLDNEAGRWALDLYARARGIAVVHAAARSQPAEYYVALVPDADTAAVGFRLRTGAGIEGRPRVAYVRLGEEEWRFSVTLLHETGHVAIAMLAGGRALPRREIAAIPHTVAALTDRGTALDEGFAIALETLVAHLSAAPEVVRVYRHEQFLVGPGAGMRAEYYRPSADLLTYAQTVARYGDVRDNAFAFAPAFKGPDYLRVQTETPRDRATLRDADQLLASEGFVASFFFTVFVRGERGAQEAVVRERESAVMTVLAHTLAGERPPDAPLLLEFLARYAQETPSDRREVLDVFLDLSRGVFVDPGAAAMWRAHYLAALGLDLARLERDRIDGARERWRAAVQADPAVLRTRLGPAIRCEVAGRTVALVGLKSERPLSFDLNTVEEGVMRMVPGITDAEVASWQAERAGKPFAGVDDFKRRSGLSAASLAALRF